MADDAFSRAANIHSPVCPLTDPAVKSSGQMLLFRQQAASVLLSPTIIGLKIRVTLADQQSAGAGGRGRRNGSCQRTVL